MSAPLPAFMPENVRPDDEAPADTEVNERTLVSWPRVFRYLLPYWKFEVALLIGMAVGILLSLAYPLLMREMVDDVVTAGRTDRVLSLAGLILAATTGGVVLSGAATWLQTWVTANVLVDLRMQCYRHLQELGPAFFARRRLGDILSRMGGDLGELQSVATGTLLNVIGSVITLVTVVTALTVLQPMLLLIGAAFVPVAMGMLAVLRPLIRRLSLRIRERNADISHRILEGLGGLRSIRAHGLSEREAQRFLAHNNALVRAVLRLRLLNAGSGGLFQVLVTANLLAVLVVGVGLVQSGDMSFGDLLAFTMFQQRVYGPLQGLSGVYVNLQRAAAPVARVFELLDANPLLTDPGDKRLERFEGRVEVDHVSFSYGPGRQVLTDVSFTIEPGTTVAVVGPSGVGKSTLIDLFFRFVLPQEGELRLDGVPINELDLSSVLPQVAMVSQQPVLFDGTLRDNLRWLEPDAPEEQLLELIEAVGLAEFVESLPEGLESPIGDRGMRLSEGQRQRIGLARALVRDPALLLLDEVTAALDWESDRLVQDALRDRRTAGRTTLVVTHRLQLAALADLVIVLDEGRVAQRGSHAELLETEGLYKRLWALQRGAGAGQARGPRPGRGPRSGRGPGRPGTETGTDGPT